MKKILFIPLLFVIYTNVCAQLSSASVLTHPNYLINPRQYLSQLDTSKIKSDVLIDRVIYDNTILNVNGWDKVTSIDYSDWYHIYSRLKFAANDTSILPDFDELRNISRSMNTISNEVVIGLIDYQFKRISQQALSNGDFVQGDSLLNDNYATTASYTGERAIAASCLSHNIFGDYIKFKLSPFFYFSNNPDEGLMSVEIDFGNGQGFQSINFEEPLMVDYYGQGDHIEINVKMLFENMDTEQQQTRYARFSLYRQGTEGIPSPNALPDSGQLNLPADGMSFKTTTPPDLDYVNGNSLNYYPAYPQTTTVTKQECYYYVGSHKNIINCSINPRGYKKEKKVWTETYINPDQYLLEVAYLFAPENKSGKLRRPFIMVDGFDYKNSRNYYKTAYDDPGSLLPYQKDFRGLYKYLNGYPSPWTEAEQPEAGLAEDLRAQGFDLIFINFMYGTGSVYENAKLIKEYLNNVINSSQFRDNQTEEIVLVGPSMGGLITRMALTEMEREGKEHFVKSWISFDSPHKGANIPLSIQHALKFGSMFFDPVIKPDPSTLFKSKLDVLSQPATTQLLVRHYTQSPYDPSYALSAATFNANPHGDHVLLQNYFNGLGFPVVSKNYAITNGGTSKIYNEGDDNKQILYVRTTGSGWTYLKGWRSTNDKSVIFEGSRAWYGNDMELTVNQTQIAYDNVPGGWNEALYLLNYNTENNSEYSEDFRPSDMSKKHVIWSTFIPTSSGFGVIGNTIEEQRALLSKTWESFTNCNDNTSGKIKTPFDEIYGMPGQSEQHMAITPTTKEKVLDLWLIPELKKTTFPTNRIGVQINKTVSKPVAYNLTENVSFAGNGNTFTVQAGADVKINAGKSITFLPGFTVTSGTELEAKIQIVHAPGSHTFKTDASEAHPKNANYLKDSPYLNKVYNYAQAEIPTVSNILQASIYPNPTSNFIGLDITGSTENQTQVEIYNGLGELMLSENINSDGTYHIDISSFAPGVYFVKITSTASSSVFQSKIIKL